MKIFWMLPLLFGLLENTSAQNTNPSETVPISIQQALSDSSTMPKDTIIVNSETPIKDCYGISFESITRDSINSLVFITLKFYNQPFILKFDLILDSELFIEKSTPTYPIPKSIIIDPTTGNILIKFSLYHDIFLALYSGDMWPGTVEEYLQYLLNRRITQDGFIPLDRTILENMLRYLENLPQLKVLLKKIGSGYTLSIDPPFEDNSNIDEY